MPDIVDMTNPVTREFWKSVFLTVLAHPGNAGTPYMSPTDYAEKCADKATAALVSRVNGED